MAADILMIRHGRTDANASGLLAGRADVSLSDDGRLQAAAIGRRLADRAPDIVVSSPLARCVDTAAAIGGEVVIDERFVELDYGDWDLMPIADIGADAWEAWREDLNLRPPGGETLNELGERVRAGLAEWSAVGGRIAIVSHVSPIKAAVCWALGVSDALSWNMFVEPASISRLAGGEVRQLRSFNDTGHLG